MHAGRGVNKFGSLKLTMIQSSEINNTQSINAYKKYAKEDPDQTIRNANLWKYLGELNMECNQFSLNELIEDYFALEDRYFF